MEMNNKLVFLGMGGTIAGTAQTAGDNVGYTAAQVGVGRLLESVPGLRQVLGEVAVASEQVCQIDSKDLAHADWFALTRRVLHHLEQPEVQAIVITHGTDTLEETAYWLMRVVPVHLLRSKPVVLTCAMRPASSLTPDGPANMADAAAVAVCKGACGVLVVCAGKVHAAAHVQKVHPYRVDAFDSGEAGPVALVEEGRVRLLSGWPAVASVAPEIDLAALQAQGLPRVELLISHAGATGATVRGLLVAQDGDAPLRGLMVAGTGNGTVHQSLDAALQVAQQDGIRVARASRCAYGQIVEAPGAAGDAAFPAYELSAVKARIALMLDIATGR